MQTENLQMEINFSVCLFFSFKLNHFLFLCFNSEHTLAITTSEAHKTTPVAPVAKSDSDRQHANHDGRLSALQLMPLDAIMQICGFLCCFPA